MPAENTPTEPETAIFKELPVTKQDILNCSYSQWYNKFQKHALSRSEILPLSKEFVEYLESDDIVLPKESASKSALFNDPEPNSDNEYDEWEESVKSSDRPDPSLKFQEFHNQVQKAFSKLRRVAPKLNWSAPQDATWIMTNKTMQCSSPAELYLLLKSSDYMNHDLFHAFDDVVDKDEPGVDFQPELVLREWKDINPSMEFRCFVRDRQLLGISQRDLNHYQFLDEIRDVITETIGAFFDDVLLPKFDSNSFVFDVYLPKPFNKAYLIDFNPFARKTDSLLFSWNELATMTVAEDDVVLRLVTQHNSGRFATKAHSQNHVPKDVLDASMDSSSMVEMVQKWAKLLAGEPQSEESDSEDGEIV